MDDCEKRLPTNLRTLAIIEVMGRSDRAMTATEINGSLGLPKQTVHRLCATLVSAGYLVRDGDGKRFRPSRRLRMIGLGLLHASRAHIVRHQILKAVAANLRETVNFVVPEEDGMRYLDRVETDWPFRIQLDVGSNVPFHCTASGKTFLASLSPRVRRRFVANLDLRQHTDNTCTDPEALLKELSVIARRGYALDNEEFMDGMIAAAVPVADENGRFAAALAFHGPKQRVSLEQAIENRHSLADAAARLRSVLWLDD